MLQRNGLCPLEIGRMLLINLLFFLMIESMNFKIIFQDNQFKLKIMENLFIIIKIELSEISDDFYQKNVVRIFTIFGKKLPKNYRIF
jgi:hypothetical protein